MLLPITMLYSGLFGLLITVLIICVVRLRLKFNIVHSSDNNRILEKAIRGHANAIETIPFAVILLGLLEVSNTNSAILWILASMLFLGRVMHAIYFLKDGTSFKYRRIGMALTLAYYIIASCILLGTTTMRLI